MCSNQIAMTRRELLLAGATVALLGARSRAEPTFWIMPPPWPGNGRCLWELMTREREWEQARKLINGIGHWPWILNQYYSDEQLREMFARLRSWGIGWGLELPVYKGAGWGYDAKPLEAAGAFEQYSKFARRFSTAGMPTPKWFAFDEPIYAARHAAPKHDDAAARLRHGVDETVKFIQLMREAYPRAELGDIEPYPALTVDELTDSLTSIQSRCRDAKLSGLDFFRLDVDWSLFATGKGTWDDVVRIENFCRNHALRFSMIYWAANEPSLGPEQKSDPLNWRSGVLKQAAEYGAAVGHPDEIVLESWLHVPQHAVPESAPSTFTASVLALRDAMHLTGRPESR